MASLAYSVVITNNAAAPFYGMLDMYHDDDTAYDSAIPICTVMGTSWLRWIDQAYLYTVPKTYAVTLDGPAASGAYTQTMRLISADQRWVATATHGIVLTVTTPTATATPTWTPTNTPATTATPTATHTATPIWTATATPVYAVQINEICPAPEQDWNHDGAATDADEYIELREVHGVVTDITGWSILVENVGTGYDVEYVIPATTQLDANGYLVIFGYQYLREDTKMARRLQFDLPDAAVCVSLLNAAGTEVDAVCYYAGDSFSQEIFVNLGDGESLGRLGGWTIMAGSPGWANLSATPTPSPTSTASPTATPTAA